MTEPDQQEPNSPEDASNLSSQAPDVPVEDAVASEEAAPEEPTPTETAEAAQVQASEPEPTPAPETDTAASPEQ